MKHASPTAGRSVRRSAAALAGALFLATAAGCGLTSPATITVPYNAADGVGGQIEGTEVTLHNFLVVGAEEGGPGAVSGAIVNDADEEVTVNLAADPSQGGSPTQVDITVPARGQTLIGPDQEQQLTLEQLPAPPGGIVGMSAATAAGGTSTTLQVPVLPPVDQYASLAPSAASTDAGSADGSTPTPTESTVEETAEPTETS